MVVMVKIKLIKKYYRKIRKTIQHLFLTKKTKKYIYQCLEKQTIHLPMFRKSKNIFTNVQKIKKYIYQCSENQKNTLSNV